jgi:general secretion pathway protein F
MGRAKVTTFSYKAATASGKTVSGVIDAADISGVRAKLEEMACLPIEIKQGKGDGPSFSLDMEIRNPFQRVRRRDLLDATQHLSSLVGAGIPVDRSLEILANLSTNPKLQEVLSTIHSDVTGGASLAEAFGNHPRIFPPLYVNMVRVGETGGVLDIILKRLAEFMAQMEELRSYVVTSMIYPAVLALVGGSAVVFLMTTVIPRFVGILEGMGQAIPLPTLILIRTSDLIRGYWWVALLLTIAAWIALHYWKRSVSGALTWDRMRMATPGLGGVVQKLALARFSRTLGTLNGSGVPILDALFIVKDVVDNHVISQAIVQLHGRVREGEGIAGPLAETRVFPSMAIHMITVGEETGRLDTMLHQVADIYEADVRTSIQRLTALLEPMMIVIMAIIVGFIVLSLVSAIMSVTTAAGT